MSYFVESWKNSKGKCEGIKIEWMQVEELSKIESMFVDCLEIYEIDCTKRQQTNDWIHEIKLLL